MKSIQDSFPSKTCLLPVFYRFLDWRKILLCGLFKDIPVDVCLFYLENSLILHSGVFSDIPRAQPVESHVASALYPKLSC